MALKKLSKYEADIKFINPETMEVMCTYNQCFQKFVEEEEYIIRTPAWCDYRPIKHKNYFHKCTECGRRYASGKDRSKSVVSYEKSIINPEQLTPEDIKEVLIQLKKIYKKTNIIDKRTKISEVFNSYKLNKNQ